ncbi:hypothetical protein F5882DRAFT_525592 [Hyaloscypha sp. PMI_1271]|nr:hypothetical protein F5882DRAFT_525592 [Hyaloscypha sp. PMI_1271]
MSPTVNLPSPSSFDNFEREQDLEALTISEGSSSPLYEEAFFTSENACGMSEAHLLEDLQMAFSIQFATGTNYLLALEMSPTLVGLVWLLPPTCGTLLQPCFGFWSDHCRSRWGKRKPFIIGGGICLSIFLLGFAWTIEVSHALAELVGSTAVAQLVQHRSINVSAQAIQVGSRALIVDHCPSHLQPQVNAWVSRICNTASIFLYLASSSDLPHLVPFLGDTRLKALALLGSFTLLITSSITCLGISNTDSTIDETKRERLDHYRVFKKFRTVATKLPTQINRIHLVQFFSWFAWYPFMVYISNYVGTSSLEFEGARNTYDAVTKTSNQTETSGMNGALSLLNLSRRTPYLYHPSTYPEIVYSVGLFGLLLSRSLKLMLFIAGLMGFSIAVVQWIPFTLINIAIIDMDGGSKPESGDSAGRAGTVLGIHNAFIAAPQILSSLACTVVFNFVKGEGQ